jgi:hypothetical protein
MTNNKQQMAVEWFFHKIMTFYVPDDLEEFEMFMEIVQQAKEMEKHRMIEFTNEWFEEYQCGLDNFKNPEKYYNETYGGGNK